MSDPETIAADNAETGTLEVAVGDRVRIVTDRFEAEGVVVDFRAKGRCLVQLTAGLFLEISRLCVEKLEGGRQ
jgi:hypothetical protein